MHSVRPKNCLFPVSRPTLNNRCGPKCFYGPEMIFFAKPVNWQVLTKLMYCTYLEYNLVVLHLLDLSFLIALTNSFHRLNINYMTINVFK